MDFSPSEISGSFKQEDLGADGGALTERNMMENPAPTIEEAVEAELCDCISCLTVPLSVLQLEAPTPLDGWDRLLEQLEIRQVVDHLGRKAIAAVSARRLLSVLKRQDEKAAEDRVRQSAKLAAKRRIGGGIPAVEGATAMESLYASPGYETPEDAFPGSFPRPNFLAEELAAGERANAEKKAANAAKRLVDSAKDKLR